MRRKEGRKRGTALAKVVITVFGLLLFSFLLTVLWFSVVVLPVFYGLSKAGYWVYRGLFSWKALLPYVVAPVIWTRAFTAPVLVLVIRFRTAADRL